MKYIDVTQKQIVRHRLTNIPAIEITSFDQLSKLQLKTKVAVMNNCDMVLGEICSMNKEYNMIYISDNQGTVTVRPDSFKYGNFMYEILGSEE